MTITNGRYVFAPPGTPHFPAPHNMWSNIWVSDVEVPPDEPILGDVTPRFPAYDKGIPPSPYPPAVVVGSQACITNGESFPPTVPNRRIIGGFDERCWTSQGVTPPDQLPWIWFQPGVLPVVGTQQLLQFWRDSSVYTNTAKQPDATLQPMVFPAGGYFENVAFQGNQLLQFRSLSLPDDYASLVVCSPNSIPAGSPVYETFWGNIVNQSSSVRIEATQVVWTNTLNTKTIPLSGHIGSPGFFGIRKRGNQLDFYYNDTVHVTLSITAGGVSQFDWFGSAPPFEALNLNLQLYEGLVFPDGLTDAEWSSWTGYLLSKYELGSGGMISIGDVISSGVPSQVLFVSNATPPGLNQDAGMQYDPDGTYLTVADGYMGTPNSFYVGVLNAANSGIIYLWDQSNGGWDIIYANNDGQIETNAQLSVPAGVISNQYASSQPNPLVFTGQVNGAGSLLATMTNSPVAGNPGFWLPISINGVNYWIPLWA
jgi:hypothetical protein